MILESHLIATLGLGRGPKEQGETKIAGGPKKKIYGSRKKGGEVAPQQGVVQGLV